MAGLLNVKEGDNYFLYLKEDEGCFILWWWMNCRKIIFIITCARRQWALYEKVWQKGLSITHHVS